MPLISTDFSSGEWRHLLLIWTHEANKTIMKINDFIIFKLLVMECIKEIK